MGTSQRRLSVVITAWSGTQILRDMLLALCQQVRPMCDELIVSEDSDTVERGILELCDKYNVHSRYGHARNLVVGLKMATMDFIALLDSDITITQGSLRDLCIPGKIVSPGLKGWFMVGPRELLVEFPPFENNHHIEGIDNWWMELQKRYQVVSSKAVTYHHAFNQTASELSRWKRLQEIEYATLHPSKEIDPQR